ncbi:GNAT family N-acetyltransferase [Candidatus Dependentiae bacterium]|nr:GNAT family N-acetyltransferase [Candidatus Dependentiae bacterium]
MSKKYEIRLLTDAEFEKWDSLVDASDEGTLFHKSYWLKNVHDQPLIYGYFKNGILSAGFTGSIIKRRFGYSYLGTPLLTPYSGPVFYPQSGKKVTHYSNCKEILEDMIIELKDKHSDIEIKLSPWINDIQPFIWNKFDNKTRFSYVLDITDLDKVWNNMDSGSCRNDINKGIKDGLKVENCDDFNLLISLVENTFDRQDCSMEHFRKLSYKIFEELNKRGQCRIFICRDKDGEPIAGNLIIWDTKRSYYILGGYKSEKKHHGGSSMVLWESIRYSSEKIGLRQFDFEGSMLRHVERFFRKFGGDLCGYQTVSIKGYYGILYDIADKIYYRKFF